MTRGQTNRRTDLIESLMQQARRTGSVGLLHGRAAADLAGIGDTDWQCIDVLDWTGPISAGELARHLGVTSGAVTGVLDRLEKAGLVQRTPDPADRRRVIATLCDPSDFDDDGEMHRGMSVFAALAADMDALNDRFDDDQLETILAWLTASNDAVEASIVRFRAAQE